jgi:hypothetical protein
MWIKSMGFGRMYPYRHVWVELHEGCAKVTGSITLSQHTRTPYYQLDTRFCYCEVQCVYLYFYLKSCRLRPLMLAVQLSLIRIEHYWEHRVLLDAHQ